MSAELHAAELNSKWIKEVYRAGKAERRAGLYLKLAPVLALLAFMAGAVFSLIVQACFQ